jgi:hypothetical protein
MHVEKTFRHNGITLAHGSFEVRETVHVCAAGCRKDGRRVRRRQEALARILLPRSRAGYDVMVFIGLERFVHHRQREEIRAALQTRYAIALSTGEISELARRFLVYLEALHRAHAPELRAALEADGGWPMHLDATGEDGRGTLLVVYAGWRRWVLGAWKIPTERADAILPRLRTVVECFGAPCAVMRDLGRAVTEAARDLVASLSRTIPVLACHLHFLKDVGKDLLGSAHDELRALFRRLEVTGHLRALARDVGRSLGSDLEPARLAVAEWLGESTDRTGLPQGHGGSGVVRALAQWVLDYPHDGHGDGFPFDMPWLDLYRRCCRACRVVEAFLRIPGNDPKVHKILVRFNGILDPVRSGLLFHRSAAVLEARGRLFAELRDALRLKCKPPPLPGAETEETLRNVKTALDDWTRSLRERRPGRGPAQDMRQAIDLILAHLERHGTTLWGHAIARPPSAGGGVRLVDRTNNLLEGFFHEMKHGERRRSGRKILTQDFERLPAAAALAFNLTRPDYVAILCGSIEQLPRAFAQLDAGNREKSLPARALPSSPDEHDVVSSSMPIEDRHIVRTDAMNDRLLTAARSRAPHRSRKPQRGTSATMRRAATVV